MRWSAEHGVDLSRVGQSLIPLLAPHPSLPYDREAEHGDDLREIGELARSLDIRLSMHPRQFFQPGSLRPEVSERRLAELRYVARVFDLISNPDSAIVLHLGGKYVDRKAISERFFERISRETGVLRYLKLENAERVWPVVDMGRTAFSLTLPAVTDAFHRGLNRYT